MVVPAAGTSEDVAMLLASEKGAELIVSVGAHFNLVEFLDKQRSGMSSTFLTRLRIGEILVDAKGVSRLYNPGPSLAHMALFFAAFAVLLVIVVLTTPALERPRATCSGSRSRCSLGYSARYHAASLAAVFLALAVGILIGAGLGDNVLSDTEDEPAREPRGRHRGGARRGRRAGRASSTASAPSRRGPIRRSSATRCGTADRRASRSATCPPTSSAEHRGRARADRGRAGGGRGRPPAARTRPRWPRSSGPPFGERRPRTTTKLGDLGATLGAQLVRGRGKQLDQVREIVFARASVFRHGAGRGLA